MTNLWAWTPPSVESWASHNNSRQTGGRNRQIHTRIVTITRKISARLRTGEREATTVAQCRQHREHIIRRVGSAKLADLTTPGLNKFRDELLTTMSRPMARKVMSSLKSLLKDAQRRGNVAQNVALAVKRIDVDKRSEGQLKIGVQIPAPGEIKAILAAAEPRIKPLLMVAAFTGLRSSELRGLRWCDVDLKNSELHVRQRADRYGVIGKPKSKASYCRSGRWC
jgi:integrase